MKKQYLNLIFQSSIIFFFICGLVNSIFWVCNSGLEVLDTDGYLPNFKLFLEDGLYNSVARGTTVVYYGIIYFFYSFFQDINKSFFATNFLVYAFLISYPFLIFHRNKLFENKFLITVYLLYLFKILTLVPYVKSSNDYLLAVFIILSVEQLFKLYHQPKPYLYRSALIGFFFALALGTRLTAIFLIPIIFLLSFIKFYFSFDFLKFLSFFLLSTLFFSFIIHYPALKESSKFSFYIKEPNDPSLSWFKRNYLGFKKIENQNLDWTHDNRWSVSFNDVKKFQQTTRTELPNNVYELIFYDFELFIKVIYHNILSIFKWLFRFSGLLLILALFKYNKRFIYILPFIVFALTISVFSFATIEFRWFIGYDFLLIFGLAYCFKNQIFDNKAYLLFSLSLFIVGILNIRSLISLIHTNF